MKKRILNLNRVTSKQFFKFIIILILAFVGVHILLSSHAASPYVAYNASAGNVVAPAIINQNDSTASNGKSVIFGNSSNMPNYHVSGNKLLDSLNTQYIPLGITVFNIAKVANYSTATTQWQQEVANDNAQIIAAADFWKVNTIRIQVAPYYLEYNPITQKLDTINTTYLNDIKSEVANAEAKNLNVIISAQYEETNTLYPLYAPDSSTETFLKTIAPLYINDTRVWFDLYNEPTANKPYSVWNAGGTGTDGLNHVGMQTLTNEIRSTNTKNIIIAESINDFTHIQGMIPNYELTGGNIVYAIHPYFYIPTNLNINGTTYNSPQSETWFQTNAWQATWGQYASAIPILVGEWSQHDGNNTECQINGAALTHGGTDQVDGQLYPTGFLQYVSGLHIGVIGWSLTPGAMLDQSGSLTSPNNFTDSNTYLCQHALPGGGTSPNSYQGSGTDMLKFFTNRGIYN